MDDDVAPSMSRPNLYEMDLLAADLDFKAIFECAGWMYNGYAVKIKLPETLQLKCPYFTHSRCAFKQFA